MRPYVIAHRGISGRYPENTLLAFQKALDAKVDWIELDVMSTLDDALIISHDGNAERCTDGQGWFRHKTLEEVKALDAGIHKGVEFAGTRIPTLDETLDFMGDGRVRICIEIKGETTALSLRTAWETVSTIRRRALQRYVVISSFDPECLRAIRFWEPLIATSLDPTPQDGSLTPWELCQQVLAHDITAMMHDYRTITPELIDEAHQHGFSLWAWTVNDPNEMRRVVAMGVDAIMSDYADTLRGIVDEMTPPAHS